MFVILCLLGMPICLIVWKILKKKNSKAEKVSLMVVAGSGGHTTEILRLVSALSTQKYSPRIYVVAESDTSSEDKIRCMEKELLQTDVKSQNDYAIIRIPRSREVGQSWFSTVFTTAHSSFSSLKIMWRWKPHVLLCNGPGTCIPLCAVALFFKAMCYINTRIIYVESICRVNDLSLSGKLLYRLADDLLVQWPELREKYPKAIYLGRFY